MSSFPDVRGVLFDLDGYHDRHQRRIKSEAKLHQAMQRFLSGGRGSLLKVLTKQGVAQTLSPVGFPHLYGLADQ